MSVCWIWKRVGEMWVQHYGGIGNCLVDFHWLPFGNWGQILLLLTVRLYVCVIVCLCVCVSVCLCVFAGISLLLLLASSSIVVTVVFGGDVDVVVGVAVVTFWILDIFAAKLCDFLRQRLCCGFFCACDIAMKPLQPLTLFLTPA